MHILIEYDQMRSDQNLIMTKNHGISNSIGSRSQPAPVGRN
ncbi:hypothetical protein Mpal_1600 [Methanosphaerula palustris E1-9c]|uniref:Uncharacterized protein n=1 Tax=Methanosphaerula palustris (strain ATCC BAA-1556 / DSM 19958 / E1-9c) TaxID=521011 RepID=B8GIU9_METPE|nr:hypothetical protein Mpal_1600 [Methanosphaerula palustris E1-9c]